MKGDFGCKISKSLDEKSVPKKKIENRKEVEEHVELACEYVNCAKKVRIESLKHGCIQMIDEIKREQDKSIDLQDWSKIEELRTRICDFQKYKNHVLKEMNQIKDKINFMTNQKSAGETHKVLYQTAIDELQIVSDAMNFENVTNEQRLNTTVKNSTFFRRMWDGDETCMQRNVKSCFMGE